MLNNEHSNLEYKDSKVGTLLISSDLTRTNNEPVGKQSFPSATLSGKNKVFPDNEPYLAKLSKLDYSTMLNNEPSNLESLDSKLGTLLISSGQARTNNELIIM